MTLTEFLLARIGEDFAAAAELDAWADGSDWNLAEAIRESSAEERAHGARWTPARVLAECEAKRRIVALHYNGAGEAYGERCSPCDTVQEPCDTLRALASVYADHDDYREAWRA